MESQTKYELYVQVNIRDTQQGGNLGFNQQKNIRAQSFEDVAKIMKQVHELFESLK
jgi:hypothetical protein